MTAKPNDLMMAKPCDGKPKPSSVICSLSTYPMPHALSAPADNLGFCP